MNKKIKSVILSLIVTAFCFSFTACFPKDDGIADKVNVVATIFPEYDWVSQIAGNSHDITYSMVVKNGVDMHSFQPSASDIIQISTADIFIYVGGESDKWVKKVLEQKKNPDMTVINLMDLLSDQIVEEENTSEEAEEKLEYSNLKIGYDEHVWLSLDNAITCVKAISDAIIEKDPENKDYYKTQTENYVAELSGIKAAYESAVNESPVKTLIFCDRFPFVYLCQEFNLDYIAAFPGCSAETEASFETVTMLAEKVKELNVKAVCKIDGSEDKLCKTVIANSKYCDIVTLDSMQSVSLRQAFNGKTYAGIMRSNLEELKKALK